MKKILLILLFLPSFVFSQGTTRVSTALGDNSSIDIRKDYQLTKTLSQFVKELKDAANNGENYLLEDCFIEYDSINDIKFFKKTEYNGGVELPNFSGDAFIEDIHFSDSSFVDLINCKFGKGEKKYIPTVTFRNCSFNSFTYSFDSGESTSSSVTEFDTDFSMKDMIIIDFDSIKSDVLDVNCSNRYKLDVTISNSKINFCNISNDYTNGGKGIDAWAADIRFDNNEINHINIRDVEVLGMNGNSCTFVGIFGEFANCYFGGNIFNASFNNTWEINQPAIREGGTFISSVKDEFNITNRLGLYIAGNVGQITCRKNIFKQFSKERKFSGDSIIKLLRKSAINYGAPGAGNGWITGDTSSFNAIGRNTDGTATFSKKGILKQIELLEKRLENGDSIRFNYSLGPYLAISGKNIGDISLVDNKIYTLYILNSNIKNRLQIEKLKVDGFINIQENNMPDYNSVYFDSTLINFGFNYGGSIYYGDESYEDVSNILSDNSYQQNLNMLLSEYRFLIRVYTTHGSPYINSSIFKLKSIETRIKEYDYYKDPGTQKWFDWKGTLFIKWFADYGMNPFKALTYCFWTMLYFAMFYFFFYSEWDKIDRGFLMQRFNGVIDYFTTEKRIEDYYALTNHKEVTTFTEFKETLDKNKVKMPVMLASLAKPIYQISILRYKVFGFFYKKAEFMAGRKWEDLQKKDRYWVGTITFILALSYIIYLVFIRALNSVVLSINTFSTLGFGNIPVRGITKYIAIVEGFIGWFMLSIFIVSLLSQMMNI